MSNRRCSQNDARAIKVPWQNRKEKKEKKKINSVFIIWFACEIEMFKKKEDKAGSQENAQYSEFSDCAFDYIRIQLQQGDHRQQVDPKTTPNMPTNESDTIFC